MPRAPRNQLVPWIESLILGYGPGEEGGGGGRLKAHVVGVGELPQSQARSSEGRPGLLFLSDGLLQLPAVLTASAWEQLQEQEERECIRSLLNSTVCIRDYRLQLCVAPQPVRCRFFLSVGELATTAAGPVRDSPPCCTTLPSVRQKILQAWGALQGPELQESQRSQAGLSQAGLDLSELLGEWQLDCVQTVLDDVQRRLGGASSPQPSTSTHPPLPTQPAPCGATTWDVDRVRHKAERRFSVPVQCLLLPQEDALRLQAPPEVSSRKPSEPPAASEVTRSDAPPPPDATQPPSDEAAALSSTPAVVGTDTDEVSPSPVDPEDETAHLIYSHITLLSNPWDVYPPPSSDASSDASLEATPTPPLHAPTAAESKPDHAAMLTSTQLPALSLERTETSGIPPYQQPPCSTSLPETAGASASPSPVSPAQPFSRAADTSLAADERCNDTAQPNPHGEDGDGDEDGGGEEDGEEAEDGKHGKRRRREEEQREEAQESGTPPFWLFDTQAGLWAEEGVAHTKGQRSRSARRGTPTVHSCGRTFSYSYQVSGQNLQDVSGLPVSESLLHWAVKYLVPKRTEPPPTCL